MARQGVEALSIRHSCNIKTILEGLVFLAETG
jgi:hypothetical protein